MLLFLYKFFEKCLVRVWNIPREAKGFCRDIPKTHNLQKPNQKMKKIITLSFAIAAMSFSVLLTSCKGKGQDTKVSKKTHAGLPLKTTVNITDQIIDEDIQEEASANPEAFLKNIPQ